MGVGAVPADTRIIAATNKNLLELMRGKKLREDLYYRLCGIEIKMPPLRERVEDIPLLAIHFLHKASRQQKGKNPLRLSAAVLDTLRAFAWPGNVRQLEQALLAAVALCEGDEIVPGNFPAWFREAVSAAGKQEITSPPQTLRLRPQLGRKRISDCSKMKTGGAIWRPSRQRNTKEPGVGM